MRHCRRIGAGMRALEPPPLPPPLHPSSLPDPVPKIITRLLPVLADLFPYLSDLGAQVLHFYGFECLNWKRKQKKKIVMQLIILNSKPNRRYNWYLPEDDNSCTVDALFFLQERCLFRPRLSILIFSADFRLELFLYYS